jgi:hypothetical protein
MEIDIMVLGMDNMLKVMVHTILLNKIYSIKGLLGRVNLTVKVSFFENLPTELKEKILSMKDSG